jgi:hypothetical protein
VVVDSPATLWTFCGRDQPAPVKQTGTVPATFLHSTTYRRHQWGVASFSLVLRSTTFIPWALHRMARC